MAKLKASRLAVSAASEAVQIHGGLGYMLESPVARFYCDAKVLEIGEGTNEIQHLVIAARWAAELDRTFRQTSATSRARRRGRLGCRGSIGSGPWADDACPGLRGPAVQGHRGRWPVVARRVEARRSSSCWVRPVVRGESCSSGRSAVRASRRCTHGAAHEQRDLLGHGGRDRPRCVTVMTSTPLRDHELEDRVAEQLAHPMRTAIGSDAGDLADFSPSTVPPRTSAPWSMSDDVPIAFACWLRVVGRGRTSVDELEERRRTRTPRAVRACLDRPCGLERSRRSPRVRARSGTGRRHRRVPRACSFQAPSASMNSRRSRPRRIHACAASRSDPGSGLAGSPRATFAERRSRRDRRATARLRPSGAIAAADAIACGLRGRELAGAHRPPRCPEAPRSASTSPTIATLRSTRRRRTARAICCAATRQPCSARRASRRSTRRAISSFAVRHAARSHRARSADRASREHRSAINRDQRVEVCDATRTSRADVQTSEVDSCSCTERIQKG